MLPTIIRRRASFESPFDTVENELNRMLTRYWGERPDGTLTGVYPVDIHEDEAHLYVDAELPGFKREEVDVTLENGMLTISAERKEEPRKGETHLNERRFTRVARSFTVPNTLDDTKVEARLDGGVLHLTLHKREEVKPRKIEVK
ncbi:MAG: Hsp20/alpha crystallin family protein [Planctomycetes bacterium]|nr:Hsp20/alpha crystallin family protein [Planctomycetota bacterium]